MERLMRASVIKHVQMAIHVEVRITTVFTSHQLFNISAVIKKTSETQILMLVVRWLWTERRLSTCALYFVMRLGRNTWLCSMEAIVIVATNLVSMAGQKRMVYVICPAEETRPSVVVGNCSIVFTRLQGN
jgi:hypothetical protein